MSKVLIIKGSPKPIQCSQSLMLGEEFLKAYRAVKPEDEITVIDLYNTDLPEIDSELVYIIENLKKGLSLQDLTEEAKNKLQRYNLCSDEFIQADKYVFVTPLWNLGLPSRVKTYIDTICVAGKTFRYTEKGPQGLLQQKKCLHIHASGGFHLNDPLNHADPFLRDIMKFLGVDNYKNLVIEGHNAVPDRAQTIIKQAYAQVPATVRWFAE